MDRIPPWSVALVRIGMGWIFLWPFLDKTFGLGYGVAREDAWIRGGSPTEGFLQVGSDPEGPLHGLFTALAGHPVVDLLFMVGILAIGLALLVGIGVRIAAAAGSLLLVLMWIAVLPMDRGTDANPFWDDHLMYAATLILLAFLGAGRYWGLGEWWRHQPLVQRNPWLI